MKSPITDKNGREIKAGDLLKVFHFIAARRRQRIYMYKLVMEVDNDLKLTKGGEYLYAVDISDAYRFGFDRAHKCCLSVIIECEIINGSKEGVGDLFWERPRLKTLTVEVNDE